jgi:hypothetical protein
MSNLINQAGEAMRLLGTAAILLAASALLATPDRPANAQETGLACITMNVERLPLDERRSPLDSVTFQVAGGTAKVCYSRPSVRGRVIFGELEAYDELWRTGANEPTMIHTTVPLSIAGISVEPGTYSLYTVPGKESWQVVLNSSTTQWGHEGSYVGDVAAAEIARAEVMSEATDELVEMLTFRSEPGEDDGVVLLLEWENTRVRIPVDGR